MAIVFTRVDDRLIHGQIVQGWLPGLNVDEFVVVINNADSLMTSLLRMSLPEEYSLKVLGVEEAVNYTAKAKNKIFLLFSNIDDVYVALIKGLTLTTLNVGGIHYRDGREKFLTDVYLDSHEKDVAKQIIKMGITLDGRSVPKEAHVDVEKILCK
ncbi:mannose/fructose/N-acetylgalactosamine-specific phosphotransferase system component IIB [Elusimicrobium simillimum]|uniref:PTS system mannose/fructose/N-acetylgalactosamine-transporter subunit IIB n=1 Tax=Elusimicrobium simillimum TaxID=3143438 RepID=UPI003C6EC763